MIYEIPKDFDFFNIPKHYKNSIWILREEYNVFNSLKKVIKFPENIILQFEGGKFCAKKPNNLKQKYIISLEGKNTSINNTSLNIFNDISNFNFTGKWNVDIVSPLWFGAKSDGKSDDTLPLLKSIELLKLTPQKTLRGGNFYITKKIIVKDVDNLTIIGNLSLKGNINKEFLLQVSGSSNFFESSKKMTNIESDVNKGESYILSKMANKFSKGDILKIVSEKKFCELGNEDIKQGEMHSVKKIEGQIIYLNTTLNDTYLLTDSARIAKINPVSIICSEKLYFENDSILGKGMRIDYGVDFKLNNVVGKNNNEIFVEIFHCYGVSININSYNTYSKSQGYGIAIEGSSMNCIISGIAMGSRHSVAFGGTGDEGGVSWDCKVSVTGSGVLDHHIFDTHYSVGRVYWLNCIGIGTITNDSIPIPVPKFSSKKSYNKNDVVIYEGWVYKSLVNSNIGFLPPNKERWIGLRKNQTPLFGFRGGENYITNCEGRDLSTLINVSKNANVSIYCKNIIGTNISTAGISVPSNYNYNGKKIINNAIINNLEINGMSIFNKGYSNENYLVYIGKSNATIKKWKFNNFKGDNFSLGYIHINTNMPNVLEFKNINISLKRSLVKSACSFVIGRDMKKIRLDNYSSFGGISPVKILSINNSNLDMLDLNQINFVDSITSDINLSGIPKIDVVNISNSKFYSNKEYDKNKLQYCFRILSNNSNLEPKINKMMISNLNLIGDYLFFLIEKVEKLMYFSVDLERELYYKDKKPNIVILNGTFNEPRAIEGYGDPNIECDIEVPIGCIYYNLNKNEGSFIYIYNKKNGRNVWIPK